MGIEENVIFEIFPVHPVDKIFLSFFLINQKIGVREFQNGKKNILPYKMTELCHFEISKNGEKKSIIFDYEF